ncbi:MAG: hypothetical protein D6791_19080 [Chloroflexi bacterium]|nr:MAG: hypothetical protein D6791_19080 [Chloroflexota bacterium]
MPAKKYISVTLITVSVTLLAACSSSSRTFRGTVVAPLETISALTPGPKLLATLTARPAATEEVAEARPPTPTPRPPTPTPRTPIPRPATPTPRPATPTMIPATPEGAVPTVSPNAYLDVPQQVGVLGDTWTLSDIRVGIHPRRIRVVWEMVESRTTAPLVEIVEVDNTKTPFPRRGSLLDPSWGAARIDVMIHDCYAYNMPLDDMLPITVPGNSIVTKVGVHPTFDDALLGFSIGLSKPAAYEIFTLTDPVRIVIDVITQP